MINSQLKDQDTFRDIQAKKKTSCKVCQVFMKKLWEMEDQQELDDQKMSFFQVQNHYIQNFAPRVILNNEEPEEDDEDKRLKLQFQLDQLHKEMIDTQGIKDIIDIKGFDTFFRDYDKWQQPFYQYCKKEIDEYQTAREALQEKLQNLGIDTYTRSQNNSEGFSDSCYDELEVKDCEDITD